MHIIYFIWSPAASKGNKIIFPPVSSSKKKEEGKSIHLIIFLLHIDQIDWGGSLFISAGGNWTLKYWRSRKQIWKAKCVFNFMAEQHAEGSLIAYTIVLRSVTHSKMILGLRFLGYYSFEKSIMKITAYQLPHTSLSSGGLLRKAWNKIWEDLVLSVAGRQLDKAEGPKGGIFLILRCFVVCFF